MGWIVAGIVFVGLVLFGLAWVPVLNRMPELSRALRRLQRRATDAQGLESKMATLQQRSAELQATLTPEHRAELAAELEAADRAAADGYRP